MNISKDKVVSVNYMLSVSAEGKPEELVEQTSKEHPFVFLFGHEAALPEFEQKLAGKQPGDRFDFSITSDNGYGSHEKDNIVQIDKTAFEIDGQFDSARVKVDAELPMR